MKAMKYIGILVIGMLCGGLVMYLCMRTDTKDITAPFHEGDAWILPYDDSYLLGNEGDTSLSMTFHEECFHFHEGEEFHYYDAIKSYEGEVEDVMLDAVQRSYDAGLYIVRYQVYEKGNPQHMRQYVKLLQVIK